jgi:pyridoxamine 5'-phosphate oxidase
LKAPNSSSRNTDARELLRTLKVFDGALKPFDTAAAPQDPMQLFNEWFRGAVQEGATEPHAMTLGTVDADGGPDLRTLILKDYDADALYFSSGARSRKGKELAAQPLAALNFYWREFGRQIRVRGKVTPCSAEHSGRDFIARTLDARAEAMLGKQSQPLGDWSEWDSAIAGSHKNLADNPHLVSVDWTLFALRPTEFEFWQADRSRRHERLQYLRSGEVWHRQMLWP